MSTEIQSHAKFDLIRYANCWEDADILVEALQPLGKVCATIGSAGDNSFSLLAEGAEKVHIVEMNPTQLACIRLRIAAYKTLDHSDFLKLHGEHTATSDERKNLFDQCRPHLNAETIQYWESNQRFLPEGFGMIGKFEDYFRTFRTKVIPLIHNKGRIDKLFSLTTPHDLHTFYHKSWSNLRWRLLFQVFFSRFMMGRLGRDPAFFKYVEGSVADRILTRTKHALTELTPGENPYLHWILRGNYGGALPHALRPENYHQIRDNLHKVEVHEAPLETFLENVPDQIDAFNLSDIFEYMSEENTKSLTKSLAGASTAHSRLAYWNMLAPRSCAQSLPEEFKNLSDISQEFFLRDQAFFYSAFHVDERT